MEENLEFARSGLQMPQLDGIFTCSKEFTL